MKEILYQEKINLKDFGVYLNIPAVITELSPNLIEISSKTMFIREFEYIFKLGNGWVPKTPKAAPYEIKILLDKCLEYCVDKRAPAVHLLKIIDNFVSMRASK